MGVSVVQSWLSDILHVVAQVLLIPTIIILLALIVYALFCIGSIIAEYNTERKLFDVSMPKFLAALMGAEQNEIPVVIEHSGLLNRQKVVLLTVFDYRILPGDALVALIRRLMSEEETHYDRLSSRNNIVARVAPMIGLMGTLIPLGPGIEALGRADTAALSSSLLIAFDTTVAGLVVAAICLVIGKIRSNWYSNYLSALDSAMATMLEKIEEMRANGLIKTQEPTDYAFLYEQRHGAMRDEKMKKQERAERREGDRETRQLKAREERRLKEQAADEAKSAKQGQAKAARETAEQAQEPVADAETQKTHAQSAAEIAQQIQSQAAVEAAQREAQAAQAAQVQQAAQSQQAAQFQQVARETVRQAETAQQAVSEAAKQQATNIDQAVDAAQLRAQIAQQRAKEAVQARRDAEQN